MPKRKILIAFYSRSGSNRKVAGKLRQNLACEIEEIVDLKERRGAVSMFFCGLDTILKRHAKIRPPKENPLLYELVVIVSPLWAGSLPPAVRAYLSKNKNRLNALAFLSVSGRGKMNMGAISDFKKISGKNPVASLLLREKEVKKGLHEKSLEIFAREVEAAA